MLRLLVVDDEVTISMSLEVLLKSLGHDVVGVASSGEKAVEMARSLNPDLILMDVVMPGGMDGIDAADKIKADMDIPVIFVSGFSEEGLVNRAKHVEPFGYILKPFQEDQIKVAIDITMYKKDMERELRKAHKELEQNVEERTVELLRLNEQLEREIAERQEIEASLRESREHFRHAFENANTGVCFVDKDGHLMEVNNRFCEILGYGKKELESLTINDITYPDDIGLSTEFFRRSVNGEIKDTVYEKRYNHKEGHLVWGQISSSIVRDPNGNPIYFISHVQDITKQKLAEEAQKQSEARARALLNAPSDSALLLDLEGTVLAANKIAAKRLGKTVNQLLGTCSYDLFPPALAKSRKTKVERVINSGNPHRFKDERAGMILDSTIYPVFDETGKVVQLAIYGKDITKERKALEIVKTREKELEARTRSLEDANTALSVLLRRREEEKTDLEERVFSNLKTLVRPHIERLKKSPLDAEQKAYLNALESSLENIISPFVRKFSSTVLDLTPMEIRVASLVREGKTNKEIAELLSLSKNTILTHRFNLRRKLGIKNKKVNLRSHLLSFH